MRILQEFKRFALRGTVIDMAFGVVVGTAFVNVVTALVNKVLLPPLGLLLGNVDFSHLRLILKAGEAGGQNEVAISYGLFLQDVINFVLVAAAMFLIIRALNRWQHEPQAPEATPENVLLLREIRDLLRVKGHS